MAKKYIITVALLLSLPACTRKKTTMTENNNTVKKHMETDGDVKYMFEMEPEDEEEIDEDSKILESLFRDEDEELEPTENSAFEMESEEMPEEGEEFSWVDAQADDEFKTVHFNFNHYGIRADQKKALEHDIAQAKELVAEVGQQAKPLIVIEGHACQEGSPAYNLVLSEKRAKCVADLFVEAGIDKDIIKVVGRGQEVPVVLNGKAVNGTREDRAPNRRVEVRVIYT